MPSSDPGRDEPAEDARDGGSRTKRVLAEGGAVTAAAALGVAGAAALKGRRPRMAGIPLPLPRRSGVKRAADHVRDLLPTP